MILIPQSSSVTGDGSIYCYRHLYLPFHIEKVHRENNYIICNTGGLYDDGSVCTYSRVFRSNKSFGKFASDVSNSGNGEKWKRIEISQFFALNTAAFHVLCTITPHELLTKNLTLLQL